MRTAWLSMAIVLAGLLVPLSLESPPEPKQDVSVTTLAHRVETLRGLRFARIPAPSTVSASVARREGLEDVDRSYPAARRHADGRRGHARVGAVGGACRARGRLARRAILGPRNGITTLTIRATSVPLITSARRVGDIAASWSPKSCRSVLTTENAMSQAARVVARRASMGKTVGATSR